MKVLDGLRVGSREFAVARVFPDVVDVIRSIHSFQLSMIGNTQLLLTVTFDGPWESYMRVVWQVLGPVLDLLLINCVDYEAHASDKGFDRFSAWVRRHQIEAGVFYAASACSVDDIRYLTQLESKQLNEACPQKFDRVAAAMVAIDAIRQAEEAATKNPKEVLESGLAVISTFYSLQESYPDKAPDGRKLPDGYYLHRAANETLKTFNIATIPAELKKQFASQLAWFNGAVELPEPSPPRDPDYRQMQGGILPPPPKAVDKPRSQGAHGCLLLARVVDAESARTFLGQELINYISHQGGDSRDGVYTNIAFTIGGLRRLGVSETVLARFPKEFREGMEARAGLLGDVQSNHPKRWSHPEWNWPDPAITKGRVRLSTIDIVVKMRISGPPGKNVHSWGVDHPLYPFAMTLFAHPNKTGVQVMSVQPMLHHYVPGEPVVDHFGFVDGISQPTVEQSRYPDGEWNNNVKLGELFLGYDNDRGDSAFLEKDDPNVVPGREVGSLLDNGTFLVVRKLEQKVEALEQCISEFLETPQGHGLTSEDVHAKMMGRQRDGAPITTALTAQEKNAFTYKGDDGSGCPLHAHIRRGNPREGRVPRIMRRGMSYGPRYQANGDNAKEDRGLMFLAYNSSIAEQFEVIQRWMAGGNSTGGFSGHTDPFLRVPQNGENAIFRFIHDKDKDKDQDQAVRRIGLGCEPFVNLKWGMYLFVPSMKALHDIASESKSDTEAAKAKVALGERVIASLRTDDDWSAILEDVTATHSGTNEAVYAAIRARGGVLRTPGRGMVLVASEPIVMEVLGNDGVFSVSEYKHRMSKSIGEIYLGLDSGEEYRRLSKVNALVSNISEETAFARAETETKDVLAEMLANGPTKIALAAVAD